MTKVMSLFKDESISKAESVTVASPRLHWKWRFYFALFKLVVILLGCVVVGNGVQKGWRMAQERANVVLAGLLERVTVTKVEYRKPKDAVLDDIIKTVAKEYGIDPLILTVIVDKESAGGKQLYRFEPRKFSEREATDRRLGLTDDERRMENSSHGVGHVMGYTARQECSMHYSELYDPWDGLRCAAKIVHKHWANTAHLKSPGQRLWETFKRFNGGGPDAERYATDSMSRLATLLYKGVVGGKT
jgi:hypothetical protein